MAVDDAHVFPGFLTPILSQLSFHSHKLLFSLASAEVRGKDTPERKFTSTEYRTRNHQVMSQTRSPLNHQAKPMAFCGLVIDIGTRFVHRSMLIFVLKIVTYMGKQPTAWE